MDALVKTHFPVDGEKKSVGAPAATVIEACGRRRCADLLAIIDFRTLVGGLKGSQSLAETLALCHDAVLGEKETSRLVLTDEQQKFLDQANVKATAPVEANVIELMDGVRKNLVDRLARDFFPGFVEYLKSG